MNKIKHGWIDTNSTNKSLTEAIRHLYVAIIMLLIIFTYSVFIWGNDQVYKMQALTQVEGDQQELIWQERLK